MQQRGLDPEWALRTEMGPLKASEVIAPTCVGKSIEGTTGAELSTDA